MQGVSTLLLRTACTDARKRGARYLEGYPSAAADGLAAAAFVNTGLPGPFQQSGFRPTDTAVARIVMSKRLWPARVIAGGLNFRVWLVSGLPLFAIVVAFHLSRRLKLHWRALLIVTELVVSPPAGFVSELIARRRCSRRLRDAGAQTPCARHPIA